MTNSTEIRTGRHCTFLMHVHLVFVTKYRRKIFNKEHLDYLQKLLESVCQDFEAILVECNGEPDHIHLLVQYPPKMTVSKLVNSLKGVSSRKLRIQFPDIAKLYWKNILWSPSYFAGSCGGAPIDAIKHYIQQQKPVH